ncbi:hypothetical protein [Acaryochloris sp. IP29b_bin.137]|uniref:hypothetical protein n=1 Tax=Acaryochloris sp. IP29b_bin.137 TaxID=2969217 RepID=UPI00261B0C94|nr:hypothetical protein [Acaryochloris sp. IP29b_bin.137]
MVTLKGKLEQFEQQKQGLKGQKQGLMVRIKQKSQAFTQARYEQVEARMRMEIMVMKLLVLFKPPKAKFHLAFLDSHLRSLS